MKTVVFGASGTCGSWLVRQAVERGHTVRAVVRASSAWEAPEGVERLEADPTRADEVARAVEGAEVVFSCLGLRRASVLPWSRLLSPPDLVRTFVGHLARALEGRDHGPVVWISAGGVGDSRGRLTGAVGRLVDTGNVGVAYRDLEAAEARAPDDPRWTAVRPVTLLPGGPTGHVGPVPRYGLFSTVRRADVALFMLEVAEGARSVEGPAVLVGRG